MSLFGIRILYSEISKYVIFEEAFPTFELFKIKLFESFYSFTQAMRDSFYLTWIDLEDDETEIIVRTSDEFQFALQTFWGPDLVQGSVRIKPKFKISFNDDDSDEIDESSDIPQNGNKRLSQNSEVPRCDIAFPTSESKRVKVISLIEKR